MKKGKRSASEKQAVDKKTTEGGGAIKSWLAVRLREGLMLTFIMLGLYLAMALVTYSPLDPGWTRIGPVGEVSNFGGRVGAWLADVFLSLFGFLGFLFPFLLLFRAWTVFRDRHAPEPWNGALFLLRFIGMVLCLICGDALLTLHLGGHEAMPSTEGGIIGRQTIEVILPLLSFHGTTLVLSGLLLFWYYIADRSVLVCPDGRHWILPH